MPFYAAEVYLFIYPLLGSGAGTRDNPPLCPLNAVIIDIIRFENISQLQTPFVGGLGQRDISCTPPQKFNSHRGLSPRRAGEIVDGEMQ